MVKTCNSKCSILDFLTVVPASQRCLWLDSRLWLDLYSTSTRLVPDKNPCQVQLHKYQNPNQNKLHPEFQPIFNQMHNVQIIQTFTRRQFFSSKIPVLVVSTSEFTALIFKVKRKRRGLVVWFDPMGTPDSWCGRIPSESCRPRTQFRRHQDLEKKQTSYESHESVHPFTLSPQWSAVILGIWLLHHHSKYVET